MHLMKIEVSDDINFQTLHKFDFWNVHGLMNTSGLLPKSFTLTLQETRSIHDSMNIPKIEFIGYIHIS